MTDESGAGFADAAPGTDEPLRDAQALEEGEARLRHACDLGDAREGAGVRVRRTKWCLCVWVMGEEVGRDTQRQNVEADVSAG